MKTRLFDLSFYPLSAIKQAALDYRHIAKILVTADSHYACCRFLWCKAEENLTVDEFSNYVIDLAGAKGYGHDPD